MDELSYQLRDTKPSGGEIVQMAWSPKMDLIVAALSDNTILLNRLSWQRVWTLPPSSGDVSVLCWRPDGRVIAVGRRNSQVSLHGIEKGHELHSFSVGSTVTAMRWISLPIPQPLHYNMDYPKIIPSPSQSDRAEKEEGMKSLLLTSSQEHLSVLLVGDGVCCLLEMGYVVCWRWGMLSVSPLNSVLTENKFFSIEGDGVCWSGFLHFWANGLFLLEMGYVVSLGASNWPVVELGLEPMLEPVVEQV
jgi:WD40 repeat protein